MKNDAAKDNSGKPDALKGARPVWGWGRAVMPALHHSMQIQLLSQIHALLLAQNTMMAARVETQTNKEAQQRMGTAIRMGETDFTRKETAPGGRSFK